MDQQVDIYHEKQSKELCALHALNNLFQCAGTFQQSQLDAICHELAPRAWVNPHKSVLGLGNYDVNVLSRALQELGYEAVWFDKRKDPGCLELSEVYGLILNVANETRIGPLTLPLNRRHWFALREICGQYYNLDSKIEQPLVIGSEEQLLVYLREQLAAPDKLLFVVVSEDVARQQSWLRHDPLDQTTRTIDTTKSSLYLDTT